MTLRHIVTKGIKPANTNPPEIAPDVNRGKAIAITGGAMVIGTGFAALAICLAVALLSFVIFIIWGFGIALLSL